MNDIHRESNSKTTEAFLMHTSWNYAGSNVLSSFVAVKMEEMLHVHIVTKKEGVRRLAI